KRPLQKELRGKRGNGEIEALDAQRRQSKQKPDEQGHHAAEQENENEIGFRQSQREIVCRIGAHRHEPARTERELAAIAGKKVEAERRDGKNQDRDQHLGIEILAGKQRHAKKSEGDQQNDKPAVLKNRKDRLIRLIRRLELADF